MRYLVECFGYSALILVFFLSLLIIEGKPTVIVSEEDSSEVKLVM